MTGIAIINIHQNIEVDIDRVIDRYGGCGNTEIDFSYKIVNSVT